MQLLRLTDTLSELNFNENVVLISGSTPVAAYFNRAYYRTKKCYTFVIARHANQWLESWGLIKGNPPIIMEQEFFDNLIEYKLSGLHSSHKYYVECVLK